MEWLSPSDAEKLLVRPDQEPQTFLFFCGHGDLTTSLPVKPRHISTDEGAALPTNEWVGLIGDRPVVIQQEQLRDRGETNPVTVLTPFPSSGAQEWSPLRELAVLPEPIQASRPLYIQSHSTSRDHVVRRPNKRGWNDVLYRAASRDEAEDLLHYLRREPWNRQCFIGSTEPPGQWTIFAPNGSEARILGAYPEVDAALQFASRMSMYPPHEVLLVKDVSERRNSNEYRIVHGRLERAQR